MKLLIVCVVALVASVYGQKNTACDSVKAYQSTTGTWGGIIAGADRAIDSNKNSRWFTGGCTHTAPGDPNPYLTIDLGCQRSISSVEIINRSDCCTGRLNNFEIVVTDHAYSHQAQGCSSSVCAFYAGSFPAGKHSVKCYATGRFVTIRYKDPSKQPSNQRYLHVCDVKVVTA